MHIGRVPLSFKMWQMQGRCWSLLPVYGIWLFCQGVKDIHLVFLPCLRKLKATCLAVNGTLQFFPFNALGLGFFWLFYGGVSMRKDPWDQIEQREKVPYVLIRILWSSTVEINSKTIGNEQASVSQSLAFFIYFPTSIRCSNEKVGHETVQT